MKEIPQNKIGFCEKCHEKGMEIKASVIFNKTRLCGLHITKLAIEEFAQSHFNKSDFKKLGLFQKIILNDLSEQLLSYVDDCYKEEMGILD